MKIYISLLACFLLSACATTKQPVPVTINETPQSAVSAAMADAAYSNLEWEKSEQFYLQLLKESPNNAHFWYRLGNIYSSTNRNHEAIVAYNQAIKLDPQNPHPWFNLGMVQLKQSAYTFNAMQSQLTQSNPMNARARDVLDGIMRLLNE